MSNIPDWNSDLDFIYEQSGALTQRFENGSPLITRTINPNTGKTVTIHATVHPTNLWPRSLWILFDLSHAGPQHPEGSLQVQSWAVHGSIDDALIDLALLAARVDSPVHESILIPSLRPEKRAKPGPMTSEHAAHRVWQLVINRAQAALHNSDPYPLTLSIDGLNLHGVSRYARIKAAGTIHGNAFRFSTTTKGYATLTVQPLDGSHNLNYGPIVMAEHNVSVEDTTDQQLATLILALLATPPAS